MLCVASSSVDILSYLIILSACPVVGLALDSEGDFRFTVGVVRQLGRDLDALRERDGQRQLDRPAVAGCAADAVGVKIAEAVFIVAGDVLAILVDHRPDFEGGLFGVLRHGVGASRVAPKHCISYTVPDFIINFNTTYESLMTSEQLRMARAALKIGVRELSALAGVDKTSIVGIENGRTRSYASTREKLRRALEAAGIVFLEAREGVHGATVALKWGIEPAKTGDTQGDSTSQGDDTGALDALGWDWESELPEDDEPLPPLDWTDEDRTEQIEHWRSRPEKWAALHEVSRQCLLRAMRMERL
jgi:transcriptional regulator with XRE-family HTH domain